MPTLDLSQGLSVVIPFYNEGENTCKSVEAVSKAIEQTNLPFEIIVVNDGSTDGVDVSNFSEQVNYIYKEHSGRLETRLKGLEAAIFPNILFIDSRVWLEGDSLSNLSRLIEENPTSRFWNGYVILNSSSPISSIWETLVGVGWKRISKTDTVKFDISEFDQYPKGTGFFLASKSDWALAFGKMESHLNPRVPISDDTKLLREFARISEIWISGQVSARYISRDTLGAFLRNSFYRGQTFVDSYWHSPTIFGKLVRWSLPLGLFLTVISIVASGVSGFLALLTMCLVAISVTVFLYSLMTWKDALRAFKESIIATPLVLFFGFGFVRAYVLGFQSRRNV